MESKTILGESLEFKDINNAIDVRNISVSFGSRHILEHIDFSVKAGCITTLIGPNGCGKSTLLKTMIGHIKPQEGSIAIQKKSLQDYTSKALAQHMAFLPQVPDMPKDMTVDELVYCGRFPCQDWWRNTAKEDRLAVENALTITKTIHLRDQLIPSLSGGERQRVWIAMALAQQPKLLVLDEPTTYLDINHQFEIMELLKSLNGSEGITVLMVLHELNQAAQYSHDIAVLNEGHIVAQGAPKEIMTEELLHNVFSVRTIIENKEDDIYIKVKGL